MNKSFFTLFVSSLLIFSLDSNAAFYSFPEFKVESSYSFNLSVAPQAYQNGDTINTDRDFLEGMLDYFCRLHFKKDFGWNYKEGSIVIDTPQLIDNNQVSIIGRWSYYRNYALWKKIEREKEFKATILKIGDNEYKITLYKLTWIAIESLAEWENTIHNITYP